MGYLSCKAISAVSTSNSHLPTSSKKPNQTNNTQESSKSKPIKIQEFNYSDLEAATNGFSEQKFLGRGSHGLVYKGVLKSGRQVAIKKPSRGSNSSLPPQNSSEVENEFDILSKLNSSRLVNLVGFTNNDSRGRLLVVEFMRNGTLYDVLHSDSCPPNWGRRIKLALQIAKAVDILHSLSPPVIHRDIKSANVLLDRNFNARLGDFGLALRCHVDDFKLKSTPPAGTMGYLDPCYVTPDNLSTKTDVFSFGILLLEILSGRKAIDVVYSPPSIVDWAIPLIRRGKLLSIYDPRIPPPKDPLVRKQLAVVAAKCVRSCWERRPTMKEVVHCLSGLSKLVSLNPWTGFTNPCMMVAENVGRPVELRGSNLLLRGKEVEGGILDGGDGADITRILKGSRRVHSDLGMRNNLMDLMNDNDGIDPSKVSANDGLNPRSGNDLTLTLKRIHSQVHSKEKGGMLSLMRNHSVKESSLDKEIVLDELIFKEKGGMLSLMRNHSVKESSSLGKEIVLDESIGKEKDGIMLSLKRNHSVKESSGLGKEIAIDESVIESVSVSQSPQIS